MTRQLERYGPGSILRIRLKDFLTYDYIDFDCGSSLNFVLGPNGTGKSSLVCAICLGLAGKPETLFRAHKLGGFVRHGQDKAVIEIELKGMGPEEIVTIRRIIFTDNDRSEWKLNGSKCSFATVKEIIESLNIQIDNLCNFLPQERVHSFAQLTPNNRLIETMRTVGGREMVDKYESLNTFQAKERDLLKQVSNLENELEQLQNQNASIETEVRRFAEREEIVRKIKMIQMKRPWILYSDALDEYKLAKEEKKVAAERLRELQSRSDPIKERIREIKAEIHNLKEHRTRITSGHKELSDHLRNIVSKIQKAESDLDGIRKEILAYGNKSKRLTEKITHLNAQIEELERRNREITVTEVPRSLSDAINRASIDIRRSKEDLDKLEDQVNQERQNIQMLESRGGRIQEQIGKLDDIKHRRLGQLQNASPAAYHAYKWIQENGDKFKYPVHGPIFLDISVKDQRFAEAVDNLIPRHVMFSFVTRCAEDHKTLMYHCADVKNWRISDIQLDGPNHQLKDYKPRLSHEQMRQLGFEFWAVDQLNGPDPVLTALCEHSWLHDIPITRNTVNDDLCMKAGLRQYIADNMRCSIKVSKYGAKNSSMRANRLRPAFNLTNTFDDEGRRHQLEQELSTIIEKLKQNKATYEKASAEYEEKRGIVQKHRQEKERLGNEKKKIQEAINERDRNKFQIERRHNEIQSLQKELSEKNELEKLQKDHVKACNKCCDLVLEYMETAKSMSLLNGRTTVLLQILQLTKEHSELETSLNNRGDDLKNAERVLQEVTEKTETLQRKAKQLKNDAQAGGALDDRIRQAFSELPTSIEDLDEILAAEQARLDLTDDTDPHLVEMYNNRRRQITTKETSLRHINGQLNEMRENIAEIKNSWETGLHELIEQVSNHFSEYFSKINCAGEVVLNKLSTNPNGSEADYSNWGIDLLVKFRDNEPLSALTAHRQSGGERSVTIIIYLLSLQKFSQSPFRVVDEINQGMDPRNERLIHRQMIETVCCGEGKSQYFLITPKLLPDLDYHENMRVLTVYNGEWMPEGQQWKSCSSEKWTAAVTV